MFPSQRRRHRLTWYVLLPVLPLLWLASVAVAPDRPVSGNSGAAISFSAGLLMGDSTEAVTLLLSFDKPLRVPTILVYLKDSEASATQDGVLLGKLTTAGDYRFPLPKPVPSPLHISGYDPIHRSTVFNLSLN